jgi:ligand-binding sensor domain-containing protein
LGDEGELYRWKNEKAENYTTIINPEVNGLDQGLYDAKHKLWWFCSNVGLIAWNGKTRFIMHSGNGLNSDSPWSITQDSLGRIWIGHEKGVECIDVDAKKILKEMYGLAPLILQVEFASEILNLMIERVYYEFKLQLSTK